VALQRDVKEQVILSNSKPQHINKVMSRDSSTQVNFSAYEDTTTTLCLPEPGADNLAARHQRLAIGYSDQRDAATAPISVPPVSTVSTRLLNSLDMLFRTMLFRTNRVVSYTISANFFMTKIPSKRILSDTIRVRRPKAFILGKYTLAAQ